MAPMNRGAVELYAYGASRSHADAQKDVSHYRYQRSRRTRTWMRSESATVSMPRPPSAERQKPRQMAQNVKLPAALVKAVPKYMSTGRVTAGRIRHPISVGRPTVMQRSARGTTDSSLSPTVVRQQQYEARPSTIPTMNLAEGKKSRRQVRNWTRPMITGPQSRMFILPRMSLAPIRTATDPALAPTLLRPERGNGMTDGMPAPVTRDTFDARRLNNLISDQLERIAMRPSSSMTGYDPRVSPSFPGAPSDV